MSLQSERDSSWTEEFMGVAFKKKYLFFAEWCLTNLGSIIFLVASYMFNPKYSTLIHIWAAILFIVGSIFYTAASTIVFIRNGCASWKDPGLSINSVIYIVSNILFIIGSFFFLPSIEEHEPMLVTGLLIFVVASTFFFCCPGIRHLQNLNYLCKCPKEVYYRRAPCVSHIYDGQPMLHNWLNCVPSDLQSG